MAEMVLKVQQKQMEAQGLFDLWTRKYYLHVVERKEHMMQSKIDGNWTKHKVLEWMCKMTWDSRKWRMRDYLVLDSATRCVWGLLGLLDTYVYNTEHELPKERQQRT